MEQITLQALKNKEMKDEIEKLKQEERKLITDNNDLDNKLPAVKYQAQQAQKEADEKFNELEELKMELQKVKKENYELSKPKIRGEDDFDSDDELESLRASVRSKQIE